MNYLVIYPGRFHPFHLGHKASYDWLAQKFGENAVYIVSSDKQNPEDSPFTYEDKTKMATKLGVPAGHIQQVKNPYQATEITAALSDEERANTVLVFAVSAKDAERFNFAPKKDGSPSYLQPLPEKEKTIKPMTQHGYVNCYTHSELPRQRSGCQQRQPDTQTVSGRQ
jgi:cytidyltransferase-like protein